MIDSLPVSARLEQLFLLPRAHVFLGRFLESGRVEPRHVRLFPGKQVFDGYTNPY